VKRSYSIRASYRSVTIGGVWRCALVLALVLLAGCGGGSSDADRAAPEPAPPAPEREERAGRFVTGEVRTPDARSALVQGHGLWACETDGRIELRVDPQGIASLFVHGRLLASVAPSRALVNRDCHPERRRRLPRFRAEHSAAGASHLRCVVPATVLVDTRDGDLVVRDRGGRFLLGAAVSDEHLEAAGHWSAPCELSAGG
jgi:hypothetical protein